MRSQAASTIPAIYTQPRVKGQKNDYNDAEAVAEAVQRRTVAVAQTHLRGCWLLPTRQPICAGDPTSAAPHR